MQCKMEHSDDAPRKRSAHALSAVSAAAHSAQFQCMVHRAPRNFRRTIGSMGGGCMMPKFMMTKCMMTKNFFSHQAYFTTR